MNSKIALWSIALGLSFLAFTVNAFRKSKSAASNDTAGFVLYQSFDHWFDLALYPVALGFFGITWGFAVMFVASLILNTTYIIINSNTKTDWTLRDKVLKQPLIRKFIDLKLCRIKIGTAIVIVILALEFDSFYVVNFLFGKDADLRKIKTWIPYLASHFVCNAKWTFLLGLIVVPIKFLLDYFPHLKAALF